MKLKNSPGGVNARRINARERLQTTLLNQKSFLKAYHVALDDKTNENLTTTQSIIDTERGIVKIENEIQTLDKRIESMAHSMTRKNKKYRGVR
jgi:predicted  nucleic acid-binding Zn-ribbon protein